MDIELLTPEGVRYWGRRVQFPEEAIEALTGVAQTIIADPVLLESFIRYHEATVQRGEWFREWQPLPMDPLVVERMGANSDQFYLLGYLSALPRAWQAYQQRGIDAEIFDATMSDLRIWLLHHYELSGRWTFGGQFAWLWRHLAVEFFRLGRLQFALIPFNGGVTGLRRRSDGKTVLLADPNLPLRADGYAFGAGQQSPHGTSWQPVFAEEESGWRGQVIAPLGFVTAGVSTFPKSEWEICLQKGDTVLDIHIARTDRFTVEDCRDSLRQALDFFARYEPQKTIRAGFCHTWFFTPQLQSLLPRHSNIVRFQREFYLYPFPGSINFCGALCSASATQLTSPKMPRVIPPCAAPCWIGLRQVRKFLTWRGCSSTARKNGAASRTCSPGKPNRQPNNNASRPIDHGQKQNRISPRAAPAKYSCQCGVLGEDDYMRGV